MSTEAELTGSRRGELAGVDRRITKNVVDALARLGPTNRKTVADLLGVGRSTLARAVTDLLDARVLVEQDTPPRGRGRPETLLTVNPLIASALGLDFGLRHIRAAAVDAAHRVLATSEVQMPMDYSLDAALDAAEKLLHELAPSATGSILGVGVALPGPLDRSRMILTRSSILPGWAERAFLPGLEERFPYRVLADNESNLAAYAEKLWGVADDAESMVYLKLHSGVGGAILMDGRIVRGQHGSAGELGHLSRSTRGKRCRCGNRGCLEASIGVPRILARISHSQGRDVPFAEAVRLVASEDPSALSVVSSAGHEAGRALGTLANALDPQCMVVGGALLAFGEPLMDAIDAGFRMSALPAHASIPLRKARLGRFGSALGGTALVLASGFDELLASEARKGRARLQARGE